MTSRQLFVGAGAQVLSRGIMLVVGFGLFLYLSRSLGPEGYGLYSVAFSVNNWVFLIVDAVMVSSLIPMLAGNPRGRDYVRTSMRLSVLVGSGLAGLGWCIAPLVASLLQSPGLVGPLRCVVFAIPLQLLSHSCSASLVGEGKFVDSASSYSLMWITRLAVAWCLVEAGWGPMGAALAIPISFLVQFLVYQLQGITWVWQAGGMSLREWWSHTRDLATGGLMYGLLFGAELPLLKRFVSSAEAGYYAVAQNLGVPLLAPYQSLLPVFQQGMARHYRDGNMRGFTDQANLLLRLVVGLAGGVLASTWLVRGLGLLMFGPRYEQSALIGQILLFELAGRVVNSAAACIVVAQGDRQRLARLYLLASLPLLMIYPLVLTLASRFWPAETPPPLLELCALVSGLRTVVITLLVFRLTQVVSGISVPWTTAGRSLVAGTVAAIAVSWLPGDRWAVIGQLGGLVLLYVMGLLVLGERWPVLTLPGQATDIIES